MTARALPNPEAELLRAFFNTQAGMQSIGIQNVTPQGERTGHTAGRPNPNDGGGSREPNLPPTF